MLMSCDTIEWCSLRKANWMKHCVLIVCPWGKARCLQLHCHSQGDTVLVGGPPGEKGNKGETVSEHLDGPKMFTTLVWFLHCLCLFVLIEDSTVV